MADTVADVNVFTHSCVAAYVFFSGHSYLPDGSAGLLTLLLLLFRSRWQDGFGIGWIGLGELN